MATLILSKNTGTHKPLVASSILAAATTTLKTPHKEQGTTQNPQTYLRTSTEQGISIKQAIDSFLLSCKVEGKSHGTIECYTDKFKGFLWYSRNYNWPDNMALITTNHLREFLAYLRDAPHRFNSTCPRAKQPCNSTTVQKYYRALSRQAG